MSLADRLAAEAARRFVRWDSALFDAVVAGPAVALAEGLNRAGNASQSEVLAAWLRLCMELLGHGYLWRGGESLAGRVFLELLVEALPTQAPDEGMALMARCWNLVENVGTRAAWLAPLIKRELCRDAASLGALEEGLDAIFRRIFEPSARLGETPRVRWVDLRAHDPWFFPGEVRFVAPTVVSVMDRHRPVALAVWLSDEPVVLGAVQFPANDDAGAEVGAPLWTAIAGREPGVDGWYWSVSNAWRGAASVATSQKLVVLLPRS